MIDISKYTHFVWDWNGTIIDDVQLCCDILNQNLVDAGKPTITVEEYSKIFCHPIANMYIELGLIEKEEDFIEQSKIFHRAYEAERHNCELHFGVEDCLRLVKSKGYKQSILSAHPQSMLDHIVNERNLNSFFDDILGHKSIKADTKVDYGVEWIQSQAVSLSQVLLIGDTMHDVEVAEAMGIDCLLVANGFQHIDILSQSGFPVIDNLQNLLEQLQKG